MYGYAECTARRLNGKQKTQRSLRNEQEPVSFAKGLAEYLCDLSKLTFLECIERSMASFVIVSALLKLPFQLEIMQSFFATFKSSNSEVFAH